MIKKLIVITTCLSCWGFDEEDKKCVKSHYKKVENPVFIPEWCPLEDANKKE
jgi:hypothetical protein